MRTIGLLRFDFFFFRSLHFFFFISQNVEIFEFWVEILRTAVFSATIFFDFFCVKFWTFYYSFVTLKIFLFVFWLKIEQFSLTWFLCWNIVDHAIMINNFGLEDCGITAILWTIFPNKAKMRAISTNVRA